MNLPAVRTGELTGAAHYLSPHSSLTPPVKHMSGFVIKFKQHICGSVAQTDRKGLIMFVVHPNCHPKSTCGTNKQLQKHSHTWGTWASLSLFFFLFFSVNLATNIWGSLPPPAASECRLNPSHWSSLALNSVQLLLLKTSWSFFTMKAVTICLCYEALIMKENSNWTEETALSHTQICILSLQTLVLNRR